MMKAIISFLFACTIFVAVSAQTEVSTVAWKNVPGGTQTFVFSEEVDGGQGTRVVLNEPGKFSLLLLDEQFQQVRRVRVDKPSDLWNMTLQHMIHDVDKVYFYFRDHRKFLMKATLFFSPARVEVATVSMGKNRDRDLEFVLGDQFIVIKWNIKDLSMTLHTYRGDGQHQKEEFSIPFEGFFDKKMDKEFVVGLMHKNQESGLAQSQFKRKVFARDGEIVVSFDDPRNLTTSTLAIDLLTFSTATQTFPIPQLEAKPLFTANSCLYQNRLYQVAVNDTSLWMGVSDFTTGAEINTSLFLDDKELMQAFDTAVYRRDGSDREVIRYKEKLIDQLDKRIAISVTDLIPGEDLGLLRIGTPWTGTAGHKIFKASLIVMTIAANAYAVSGAYVPLGDDFYLTFGPNYYYPDGQRIWEHRVELLGKTDPHNFAYVEGVIDQEAIRPLLAELPTPRIQEVKDYLTANKLTRKARAMYTFIKGDDLILICHYKGAFHVVKF